MAGAEHPPNPDARISELIVSLSESTQTLFSAGSAADTLKAVVGLAVQTVDGCDFASVFVLDENAVTTPVGTDSAAADVDLAQHRAGEGPGLDAITLGTSVYAEDLADDPRWKRFGPEAAAAGVRSALALRLSDDAASGVALCLYARLPEAFGALDRAKGVILATMAGLAVSEAEAHDEEARGTIEGALATREMIGRAQGILMERERITADEAYDILRQASQHLNTKVRDVAQVLVDTGKSPPTGSPGPTG
jgi:ANTAR domain-containing protein/GAF domain-containing protein